MTKEAYERERRYQLAMYYARRMLDNGIITEQDYRVIETKMRTEFSPIIGALMLPK